MLKKIYLSPLGRLISLIFNGLAFFHRPFMVYGFRNRVTGQFQKHTRISSTTAIIDRPKLDIGDHCWIWHHSVLDGSGGLKIGEGCTMGAWSGIYTHSNHMSIRLLGRSYIIRDKDERIGYVWGPVEIGRYTAIGSSCLILPNVRIGDGCLISSGSIVSKSVPDYSIVAGNPAKVIGKTTALDMDYFDDPVVRENYFDRGVIEDYLKRKDGKSKERL